VQATVTGKYFLEERFANFISEVFKGFQIIQEKCIEIRIRHSFNLVCQNVELHLTDKNGTGINIKPRVSTASVVYLSEAC